MSVCWGILMFILSVFLCREWTGLSTCMNKYVVAWFNHDFSYLLQELMVMFLCYASLTCLFWFIWQGINGILADEMGLGKTVQSIAFLSYLAEVSFIVHMKIYTSELPLSFFKLNMTSQTWYFFPWNDWNKFALFNKYMHRYFSSCLVFS